VGLLEDLQESKLFIVPSQRSKEKTENYNYYKKEPIPLSFKVEDIQRWFKGFKIDSVELCIEGIIKENNIVKIFISCEGNGSFKVKLKPITGSFSENSEELARV
jgi:hypothetical protein